MSKIIKLSFFILIINFNKPIDAMDTKFNLSINPNEIIKLILNDPEQKKLEKSENYKSTELGTQLHLINLPYEIIKIIYDYNIDDNFILKLANYLKYKDLGMLLFFYDSEFEEFDESKDYNEQEFNRNQKRRDKFITAMYNCHTIFRYQNFFYRFLNRIPLIIYDIFKKYDYNSEDDYAEISEYLGNLSHARNIHPCKNLKKAFCQKSFFMFVGVVLLFILFEKIIKDKLAI